MKNCQTCQSHTLGVIKKQITSYCLFLHSVFFGVTYCQHQSGLDHPSTPNTRTEKWLVAAVTEFCQFCSALLFLLIKWRNRLQPTRRLCHSVFGKANSSPKTIPDGCAPPVKKTSNRESKLFDVSETSNLVSLKLSAIRIPPKRSILSDIHVLPVAVPSRWWTWKSPDLHSVALYCCCVHKPVGSYLS